MLASITPLGERSRNRRWGITVTWFALGAIAAAAAVGGLLGALGAVGLAALGAVPRLTVLALAFASAALVDLRLGGRAVPSPRRQVDDRWLYELRGWAYGVGFGAQLGAGVVTVVSSAAIYVALLAAALTGDPLRGALVMAVFGAGRGASLLAAVHVRDPAALITLHRRLRAAQPAAASLGVAVLAALTVASTLLAAAG
jgi:sulfite exporter TauE/SafE